MFRKAFISFVAIATIGTGIVSMTSTADAHRRHHHSYVTLGFLPFFGYPGYGYGYRGYGYGYRGYDYGYRGYGYGYPAYYNDYYDYGDCGYRRVAVKKWNKSHTHRVIVYRKKRVCY